MVLVDVCCWVLRLACSFGAALARPNKIAKKETPEIRMMAALFWFGW
jgi:hypothetical protein